MKRNRTVLTNAFVEAVSYANWSIGKDLRAMREEHGLLQADVARRARIGVSTLCRIESGHGNPTVRTVVKLVRTMKALESVADEGRSY